MNLKRYFDRVVLINLKRRPDRLARVREALRECNWPFKKPEVFEAVDGKTVPRPAGWRHGPGAWGATLSHQKVLAEAIRDGVKRLLVMEDDVCFVEGFRNAVEDFLNVVPDEWDQLMIGGMHWNKHGKPTLILPGVYRCTDCERMHCYAIQGGFLYKFLERLRSGGTFDGNAHCDWILGRDPEMQLAHKVYAPEYFLAGQERGESDIYGSVLPRKFWNMPGPELSVINLHAPASVVDTLRKHGFFTGYSTNRINGYDRKLTQVFLETKNDPKARVKKLADWIKTVQWELAADPDFVCTVWHPLATPELVKTASPWKVYDITANKAGDALRQFPRKLCRT